VCSARPKLVGPLPFTGKFGKRLQWRMKAAARVKCRFAFLFSGKSLIDRLQRLTAEKCSEHLPFGHGTSSPEFRNPVTLSFGSLSV
jgi:hypothetical protein